MSNLQKFCPHCELFNYLPYYEERGGTCCGCGQAFDWNETKPPTRPAWDEYFFDLARLVSTRATCPRASIGVVIVDKQHRVISTGYNGALPGEPHCSDDGVGCEMFANHCVRARHAEVSALDSAWEVMVVAAEWDADCDRRGFLAKLEPVAYVVGPRDVCSHCARSLHAAGVKEVKVREA